MTSSEKICGLLGLATRAGKTVFGTESCMSAIEKRKVKLILLASDASDRTKTNFKEICNKNNIEVSEMLKMDGQELKQAILASEGRTVMTETVVAIEPLLGDLTNA